MTKGLPDGVVQANLAIAPSQTSCLFAAVATMTGVNLYRSDDGGESWRVATDDGDHWQSLRLNMPASSVRDLIVKNDEIVVATHGRGFWILDGITPLRQMDERVAAAPRSSSARRPRSACAGTRTPTRRSRPTFPRVRTRRTARASTTTSDRMFRGRSRLSYAMRRVRRCAAIRAPTPRRQSRMT
ncbi:MAG TPA: hypothetical protein VE713_03535 [Pyrinomonadaceae bacterium]|nr:hypothetical protein [Pyrinomonadaceae bacterium]